MADSKRKPNFLDCEKEILVESIKSRIKIISDAFNANLTKKTKDEAWRQILDEVVSPVVRTLDKIKKKYQSMKSQVKQKEVTNRVEIRKTGGGSASLKKLTSTETELLGTLHEVQLSGIPGGIELYDDQGNAILHQQPLTSTTQKSKPIDKRETLENLALQFREQFQEISAVDIEMENKPVQLDVKSNQNTKPADDTEKGPSYMELKRKYVSSPSLVQKQVALVGEQVAVMRKIEFQLKRKNDLTEELLKLKRIKYNAKGYI